MQIVCKFRCNVRKRPHLAFRNLILPWPSVDFCLYISIFLPISRPLSSLSNFRGETTNSSLYKPIPQIEFLCNALKDFSVKFLCNHSASISFDMYLFKSTFLTCVRINIAITASPNTIGASTQIVSIGSANSAQPVFCHIYKRRSYNYLTVYKLSTFLTKVPLHHSRLRLTSSILLRILSKYSFYHPYIQFHTLFFSIFGCSIWLRRSA